MSDRGPGRRRPPGGGSCPTSTYRLQLGPDLDLDAAAAQVDYLAALGVTHLYLSPVLTPAPGSTHGYDVVDHDTVSEVLGGRAALERLAATAHAAGLGLVLDVVPNHMAVPTPAYHNRALWSVLAEGPDSPYAHWFDVDWSAGEGAVLMPVLGRRIGAVLGLGRADRRGARPARPRTSRSRCCATSTTCSRSGPAPSTCRWSTWSRAQHYRLAYWRVADEELNYRRFFDVGSLAAIRVEDPEVFDATHAPWSTWCAAAWSTGCASTTPTGWPTRRTTWPGSPRPSTRPGWSWRRSSRPPRTCPTTGRPPAPPATTRCGASSRCSSTRPARGDLAALMHQLTGDTGDALPFLVERAKREIVAGPLYAEVHRLAELAAAICADDVRLRDHTRRALQDCLVELLVAADRYRYYVVPGVPPRGEVAAAFAEAVEVARSRLAPNRHETLDLLAEMLLGKESGSAGRTREPRRDELVIRFQQTCGAVMAKGVEDTAFYRWTHLVGLCEVGGAPERFAIAPEELHSWAGHAADPRPGRDDDPVHPRHQALGGHPGPPGRAVRAARGLGRPGRRGAGRHRRGPPVPCSTGAPSPSCGRPWPAPGTAGRSRPTGSPGT